jgi:hypothetical protein
MITYSDGTEARIGDRLSLSHDKDSGVVRDVVDSVQKAKALGLEPQTGLMIESVATGLTFYPARYASDEDEIRFVSRFTA